MTLKPRGVTKALRLKMTLYKVTPTVADGKSDMGFRGFQTGMNIGSLVRRSSTTVLQDEEKVSELIINFFFGLLSRFLGFLRYVPDSNQLDACRLQ